MDAVRGTAALCVCIGHTRGFLFIDHPSVHDLEFLEQVLFYITGFANEAVIIFFVLSGFLVGGNVVSTVGENKWSWRTYLLRRLTRLWIVILPTLFLTLFWDSLGGWLAPSGAYEGAYRELVSVETPPANGYAGIYKELFESKTHTFVPQDHTATTLIGNVMFLQWIVVPSFGTNIPMWSLTNEFWYYIMFPFVWLAAHRSTQGKLRAIYALGFFLVLILLPVGISSSFALFGFGVLSHALVANGLGAKLFKNSIFLTTVGGLFLATLIASSGGHWLGHKLIIGASFAVLLTGLAVIPCENRAYNLAARGLSEISYTLYLTHFPLLAFIFFTALAPTELGPYVRFCILVPTTLVFALGTWWCFERHTNILYVWMREQSLRRRLEKT